MDKLLNKIKKIIPKKLFKALQPAYHYLMGLVAAIVYRFPSNEMIVIGVTGTTGKTTCVYLIAKSLEAAGYKVGYTSTAMFNDGTREWLNEKKMTMVGRFFSQKMMRNMARSGCHFAIIETTSEGVLQYRHKFINYDILVFTGLYPEHVEAHGGFENYKKAKGRLFEHLKRCKTKYADENKKITGQLSNIKKIDYRRVKKTFIGNGDDEHIGYFMNFWAQQKIIFTNNFHKTFGPPKEPYTAVRYGNIIASQAGTSYDAYLDVAGQQKDIKINLQLLGAFNAANSLTAICVGVSQEMDPDNIKSGLESVTGIPGRIERIDEGQDFTVIVDYAFEPKALLKLYETVDAIPHARIIHVLGSAGGGRDIARRPKLGEIAGKRADIVIVTNEDPYDEDPLVIMEQVAIGAQKAGKQNDDSLFKILDRREAIQKALLLAGEQDIILITGKGSEQAICVANGEKITWDDRAVVRGILKGESLSEKFS